MTGDADMAADQTSDATTPILTRLQGISAKRRFVRAVGDGHWAAFAEGSETLVVTFETVDDIANGADPDLPRAHALRDAFGWSALSLIAAKTDWFRADVVFELFDELTEKGLFDAFERVLFFGAGTSAHAACAYSVASPGATVFAIAPQATLTPARSGSDARYPQARVLDFTSRYGYAPDMLDGADEAHVFYDPAVVADAAHAAQFNRPHIRHHPLRHFGDTPQAMLEEGGMLHGLFALYDEDNLTPARIARTLRARRTTRSYLLELTRVLSARKRDYLNAIVCNNVADRMGAPRFRKRALQIAEELNKAGITLPFQQEQPEAETGTEAATP